MNFPKKTYARIAVVVVLFALLALYQTTGYDRTFLYGFIGVILIVSAVAVSGFFTRFYERKGAAFGAVFFFALAVSPLGMLPFVLAAHYADLCTGALGSGVRCSVPLVSGYFEAISAYFEIGFLLFGASLLWAGASIALWLSPLVYWIKKLIAKHSPAPDGVPPQSGADAA